MRLVKPFFKNMWAGPLSTTSLVNNLLPGCCVDKLSSFHHLCHPHPLPSPTHAASPRTSKFIYQAFLGGGKGAGEREEESDCSKNQTHQLKSNPLLFRVGTHRNQAPACLESKTKVSMESLRKSWTSEILQDFLGGIEVDWNPPRCWQSQVLPALSCLSGSVMLTQTPIPRLYDLT